MDILKFVKSCRQGKTTYIIGLLCAVVLVGVSCIDGTDDALCSEVDSLNQRAYRTRYLCIDTTALYAQMAFDRSEDYTEGRAVACSNLAFVQYMLMDYDSAQVLYQQSADMSKSLLTKAVADVGMMKVCHVTGRNEKFHEYRNAAEQKLHRIDAEPIDLTPLQTSMLNYAKSEFHMASSAYYNYIMQDSLSREELHAVTADMSIVNSDSAQLARYYTLVGDLQGAMDVARRANLVYMQASVMQKMSQGMINSMGEMRPDSLNPFALVMAQSALWLFRQYGSIYSRAVTYLTISDFYLHADMPEVALDTATKALEFVNIQHRHVYGQDADFLMPYDSNQDSISTEMAWMQRGDMNSAWEWIATIREHLSMIYSSMGMKRQSDYNRNIYLDILDATRQDRQLEHQVYALEQERRSQNLLIFFVALLSVVLSVGLYLAIKRMRRTTERNYDKEMKQVDELFSRWKSDNEQLYTSMEEEEKKLDSETYLHEQHIAENKRSYIDKCTSLSLVYSITPFLDRAINELNKLQTANESSKVRTERVDYLRELIDRICLYNEVLSHWIKVRQGMVSLNIENFELQPLLDTLAKNQKSFTNKGLALTLTPTDAVVKADRALTLFMINTLLDNARKYTPSGGSIGVTACETDDYVEISVSDTGRGLSAEDIKTICNEKVYDSSRIGNADGSDDELSQQKGFGFGLMNCKGIIDKYRKTNAIFSVCTFNIESRLGEGSRFFFRLPKGVMRLSAIVLMLLASGVDAWCQPVTDSQERTDRNLILAAQYADSVYFANVDGLYDKALVFADSAINRLNAYYISQQPGGTHLLSLTPSGNAVEYADIRLWRSGFDTDYLVVLDVRNEAAIAALALKKWNVYRYNNDIYFRLYKLVTQDTSLASVSASIRKANITRQSLIILAVMLVVVGIITFLVIYYRIHLLPTFNMRQLMQFSRRLFSTTSDDVTQLAYEGVNDIKSIQGLALGVRQEGGATTMNISHNAEWQMPDELNAFMTQTLLSDNEMVVSDGHVRTYPLHTEPTDDTPAVSVGVMATVQSQPSMSDSDLGIIRLMARQLATYIYYSRTRIDDQRTSIELKDDERLRAEREEQSIHIQNMVLDNCLSAIKHETMYYPSRIKQILSDIDGEPDTAQTETLSELVSYYKEVFTLLSSCASRQLTDVMFRRRTIDAASLAAYARKSMARRLKRLSADIEFEAIADDDTTLVGDRQMLEYLVDNLIAASLHTETSGRITLHISHDADMVHLVFHDERVEMTPEQLSHLFYPDNLQYDEAADRLVGVEYLVCRQIVREHDEHGLRRGCRIVAGAAQPGHKINISFTI